MTQPVTVTRTTRGYCEGDHDVAVIIPAAYKIETAPGVPARGLCEQCAAPFIAEYGVDDSPKLMGISAGQPQGRWSVGPLHGG